VSNESFVVGPWTATRSQNLLERGGERIHLEPRVMDLLVYLSERTGRVVSKDELIEQIWNGRHVTDDVLTVAVYALRKALGDAARRSQYIETIPRRGYRLIAAVHPVVHAAAAVPEVSVPAAGVPETRPRFRVPAFGAAAALALFIGGAIWMSSAAGATKHVPTADAHEAYVKGRFFLDQRSIRGWQQALDHFQRAVALDARYPAAHAGVADAYAAMSDFGVASPAEMRPRAMDAAARALALDSRSPEAYEAVGRAQFLFDWDFAAAGQNLRRAAALDASYMPAYQALAWVESALGRHAEAVDAARRARQLDPVNTARYTELAWVLAVGGRYADAMLETERALQLEPRASQVHLMKGWIAELTGNPDAAFAAYENALRINGVPEAALRTIEEVYRRDGLRGYYRGALSLSGGSIPMSDTWRAGIYVRVGDIDRAIAALEQAYQKRESALAWLNVEPGFAALRSDARFQQIASRIGRRNQPPA